MENTSVLSLENNKAQIFGEVAEDKLKPIRAMEMFFMS